MPIKYYATIPVVNKWVRVPRWFWRRRNPGAPF